MGLAWRGPSMALSLCPWEHGDGHVSPRSLRAKHVSHGSLGAKHILTAVGSSPKQMLGLDDGFKGLRKAYFWRGQSAIS